MENNKFLFVGVLVAILVYASAAIFQLELFERFVAFLYTFEEYELDELFIPAVIIIFFFSIDLFRRRRLMAVEHEKGKVYRSMVGATHHILNNFLTKMMLFKIEAINSDDFDKEVIVHYDIVIEEASAQIKKLSELDEISEEAINRSIYPEAS